MKLLHRIAVVGVPAILATAIGCASTATQEGPGEYVGESVITTKVKAAFFNDATLKANEINVETFNGRVQLSGFVNSQTNVTQGRRFGAPRRWREIGQG